MSNPVNAAVKFAVKPEVNLSQTAPNASKPVPINVALKNQICCFQNADKGGELTLGQRWPAFLKFVLQFALKFSASWFHVWGRELLQAVRTNKERREREMYDEWLMSNWGESHSYLYNSLRAWRHNCWASWAYIWLWLTLTICTGVNNKFKITLLLIQTRGYLDQYWTSRKEESNKNIILIIWAIQGGVWPWLEILTVPLN